MIQGPKIDIMTVKGPKNVEIDDICIQNSFLFENMGVEDGDHVSVIQTRLPRKITADYKELLLKYQKDEVEINEYLPDIPFYKETINSSLDPN